MLTLKTISTCCASGVLNRTELVKLRLKAIRSGVWFRALPRIDRVLVDLTIRVADSVRSARLARSIFAVVGKLEGLLEGKFVRLARTVGQNMAEKLAGFAQGWGYAAAKTWVSDRSFALYCAVMQANK